MKLLCIIIVYVWNTKDLCMQNSLCSLLLFRTEELIAKITLFSVKLSIFITSLSQLNLFGSKPFCWTAERMKCFTGKC